MDIYRNLNWSRKTHRTPKEQLNLFNFNLSDDENDVFYQTLNEIDPIFVEDPTRSISKTSIVPSVEVDDNEIIIDPRTNKLVEQIIYDHTHHNIVPSQTLVKYFDKFPRSSTISKKNHQICIRAIDLLNSLNREVTEEGDMDIRVYQNLGKFRLAEKNQFDIFVQNYFNTYLVSRFSTVDEQFKNFLLNYERYKIGEWIKLCSNKSYSLQTSIPNLPTVINDEVALKFVKVVHKTGIVPFMLSTTKPNHINCAKSPKFNMMYLDASSIKFQPIERDLNVTRIIGELDETVDIIVHISSLIYLMDSSLKSWNIKITKQETEKGSFIYIGKCLPRSDLNTIDMIKRGFKCALKYSALNYHNKASWNLDDDRICGAEIKIDYHSSPPYKPQTYENYMENLKFSAHVLKSNHIYSLWNLTDEKINFTSNLLIRSKYDAREHLDAANRFVNLSSKVEFQSEFGAEIMTKTELIKEWLKQYINVDTVTKRMRIDSGTGIILSQKYLNLIQIENDLKRLHNLEPKTLLNNLISKLNLISKQFPSGEYLLQYNVDVFPHVKIYNAYSDSAHSLVDKNVKLLKLNEYLTGINLYNLDNNLMQYPNPNKIDDMEITLVHRHASITPCSFLYVDQANLSPTPSKSKNKRKKPIIILDEKQRFNIKRQEKKKQQEIHKITINSRYKAISKEVRHRKKAEKVRLLKETQEREAEEQRQFEYEYNIHGMFDEHGNVINPTEAPPPLIISQSYRYKRKLNIKPQLRPLPLPTNQNINKANYSILTVPSTSSSSTPTTSSSFSTVSSVEFDNHLKRKTNNYSDTSNSYANNKKIGKQSVLGSIRQSMRTQTVNKRRYF